MVNEDAEMQSSDKNVLQLLDSTDSYLLLMNSLSSSLRQVTFSFFSDFTHSFFTTVLVHEVIFSLIFIQAKIFEYFKVRILL